MVGHHLEPEHRVGRAVALGPLAFVPFAQFLHLLGRALPDALGGKRVDWEGAVQSRLKPGLVLRRYGLVFADEGLPVYEVGEVAQVLLDELR